MCSVELQVVRIVNSSSDPEYYHSDDDWNKNGIAKGQYDIRVRSNALPDLPPVGSALPYIAFKSAITAFAHNIDLNNYNNYFE